MTHLRMLLAGFTSLALAFGVACDAEDDDGIERTDDRMERVGEKIDRSLEKAKENAEDAAEKAGDEIEDWTEPK